MQIENCRYIIGKKKREKNQRAAFFAVMLGAVIMALAIFLPPVLGSADNGELAPVIEGNGLYKLDHGEKDEYFHYAAVKYGINQYHTEAKPVFTSRNLFITAAKGLNYVSAVLLRKDKTIFDIRWYSFLLCIYTLAGLYLLVEYVVGKFEKGGIALSAAAVFIFCDTAYLTWISSFYEESVIYPSLLMIFACFLQLSEKYHKSETLYAGFLISAGLLVTVNNTTICWGALTAGFCLLVLLLQKKKKCFPIFNSKNGKIFKGILYGMTIVFLGTGIFYQLENGGQTRTEKYHAMTRGMMLTSENPKETAEFFEIDGSYSLLENSSAYERYPAIDFQNELLEENFYEKYNVEKSVLYYVSHGDTFAKMMQLIINQAYTIHSSTGGNYDRDAGKAEGAKTNFFCVYSTQKEAIVPRAIGFLLILVVLFLLMDWSDRTACMFFLYVTAFSVCLMAAVVINNGAADATRQMFFYNVSFDVLIFFMFSWCAHRIVEKRQKNKQKAAERRMKA